MNKASQKALDFAVRRHWIAVSQRTEPLSPLKGKWKSVMTLVIIFGFPLAIGLKDVVFGGISRHENVLQYLFAMICLLVGLAGYIFVGYASIKLLGRAGRERRHNAKH